MKNINLNKILLFIYVSFFVLGNKVEAHGSKIEYKFDQVITITSKFDDGKPMKNAQVIIYSPQDNSNPWQKGITDENGKFIFTLDANHKGNWSVKVQQAGHGGIISIPVDNNITSPESINSLDSINSVNQDKNIISQGNIGTENNIEYTNLQKMIMALTTTWGFIGTALFFKRNQKYTPIER
jgi:nickel transport protein